MSKNSKEFLIDIYKETYDDVFRYILSKCENINDIQDLIQNTYLNFYKASLKKDIKEPKKYLITIARNEIFKTYGIISIAKNNIPLFSLPTESLDYNLDNSLKFNENYDLNFSCLEIWEELKKSDSLTLKIFTLHFVEDIKIKDISILLKISESTVKNRLYRKIKELKEKFNV